MSSKSLLHSSSDGHTYSVLRGHQKCTVGGVLKYNNVMCLLRKTADNLIVAVKKIISLKTFIVAQAI